MAPGHLHRSQHRLKAILYGGLALVVIVCAAGVYLLRYQPGVSAQIADSLRTVIGDGAVAQLESTVYQAQDSLMQLSYSWFPARHKSSANLSQAVSLPTSLSAMTNTEGPPSDFATSTPLTTQLSAMPAATLQPSLTATPILPWRLEDLRPFGEDPEEGCWKPLVEDAQNNPVAIQAFLQPDAERPYAQVRVVAFNLSSVHLHYLVGRDEPQSEVKGDRPGSIPAEDRQPGVLLAVFNGGFKARHGHFGVMTGGITWLPPKDGLGTLALYQDGHLKMGAWGSEVQPEPGQLAWRQNGPLIIQDGKVNPLVEEHNPALWGLTIEEMAPIWRSAIGLSRDGQVFYYAAGPSLTLPALARGVAASGVWDAIQLDINNYWVHFDTISVVDGKLKTQPLFEYMGTDFCDRYLYPYTRDYFYVTLNP